MRLPDRYKATGVTNGGGMGDIHECNDTHLNRRVVLKILKEGEESRRLLDEQKALIKIRSKHVVQLFDVISVENSGEKQTALVLEHIDGHDLAIGKLIADFHYLKTIWQVACGLVEIHSNAIIHRDIKPKNIRVDASGVVKILDFGLARSTGFEAVTRSTIGSPPFMAPEQWGLTEISFDQAVDVYAFGVLALALLYTELPKEIMSRPPSELPKGTLNPIKGPLPDEVVDVLEQCLSYVSKNRPSILDVEAILKRHLIKERHRALIVLGDKSHEINITSPSATVRYKVANSVVIIYNGFSFHVSAIEGIVFINNTDLKIGDELPDCCVIAFGPKGDRSFATFDISNPEVMP